MTRSQLIEAIQIAERLREIEKTNAIRRYFPDEGKLCRTNYPKHMQFFHLGNTRRERLFLAGNRVGKTLVGAYEASCHLTGSYPSWWQGRVFTRPVRVWAAGDTSKTVRDIIQLILMGEPGKYGTGMIPKDKIVRTLARTGLGDAVDVVHVKHVSGDNSQLTFKSYDQRRESFQGTEQDVIWLDEEAPEDIYTECLMRTMTNNGMMMLTFTPLQGLTKVVQSFLEGGAVDRPIDSESKAVVTAGWDDAPHLSEAAKQDLLASIPPFQRDARTKGIPQLGSGAIYPIPESEIVVDDFVPPKWWPRAYGLDVGWNFTAAVFVCKNPDTGVMYVYNTYKVGGERASVHAAAIRGVDGRIPGSIDPASRGRGQTDGQQLFQMYRDLGLDIAPADNAVESGIEAVRQLLISGRLKLMKIASAAILAEYRTYRRDESGKVVKENDHNLDALRYWAMMFTVGGKAMRPAEEQPMSMQEQAIWEAAINGKQKGHPMTVQQ